MTNNKIRVLCVPSDRTGCGFYRSLRPHTKLHDLYFDDFDVIIDYNPKWDDLDEILSYDIIHIHKGLYDDYDVFLKTISKFKEKGGILIVDIDDFWKLDHNHPAYFLQKNGNDTEKVVHNLKIADYVTTTTDIFAEKIRKINKNVKVFPNAIDPNEEQFIPKDKKSDRLRFGLIMGSSHENDVKLLSDMVPKLPKSVLDKIQIVLCGFDIRGTMNSIGPDGQITSRPILPSETVWYRYEYLLTNGYSIVSPEHKEALSKFVPNSIYPNDVNEPYARRWTKDINSYCTHYNDIDVLLVPLAENEFNDCKSELKLIEAGMMNKAVVASNVGPYKLGTVNLFEKGGKINPEGNCILIDNSKSHKAWNKTIEKLVEHPEYIDILKTNLHNSIKDKYNLDNVTKERAEWYKSICKK